MRPREGRPDAGLPTGRGADLLALLVKRRGMDYHRHRPQSLDHTSPRSGPFSYDEATGVSKIAMPAASGDARRDEGEVHRICVEALACISTALREFDPLLVAALADLHLPWPSGAANEEHHGPTETPTS
ncbi:hypothetical protein ABZ686_19185 [Streptomyces sp. NPDC006992]|uniref:hypothetical protein n=1 Tax=Streptomyces sp. NPDC006992 TaxID=3155601 RepID=UPI0033C70B89